MTTISITTAIDGTTVGEKALAEKKKPAVKKPATSDKKSARAGKPKKPAIKKPTKKNTYPESKPKLPAKKDDDRNLPEIPLTQEDENIDPQALERGDNPMTMVDHLGEMRSRLLVLLSTVMVVTVLGFIFSDYLMVLINKPFLASGEKLNLFKLFEGFTIRIKASLFAALLICLPIITFQIWRYISPAVNRNDRTMIRLTMVAAVLLFYTGITLTYFILPMMIITLLGFAPENMLITNNASEYMNFFVMISLMMGSILELPIVILILSKMGIVSPSFLVSKRKYAIVIIWVVAALISPPDPLSQALMAIPLMILYEVSIIISKLIAKKKKKKELMKAG